MRSKDMTRSNYWNLAHSAADYCNPNHHNCFISSLLHIHKMKVNALVLVDDKPRTILQPLLVLQVIITCT